MWGAAMVKSWGEICSSGPTEAHLWTPSSLPYLIPVLDQEAQGASCYFILGKGRDQNQWGRDFVVYSSWHVTFARILCNLHSDLFHNSIRRIEPQRHILI